MAKLLVDVENSRITGLEITDATRMSDVPTDELTEHLASTKG